VLRDFRGLQSGQKFHSQISSLWNRNQHYNSYYDAFYLLYTNEIPICIRAGVKFHDWISSKIDGCAAASGDERVFSARRLGFLFLLHFVGNLPHPHLRITVSPSPP